MGLLVLFGASVRRINEPTVISIRSLQFAFKSDLGNGFAKTKMKNVIYDVIFNKNGDKGFPFEALGWMYIQRNTDNFQFSLIAKNV